MPDTRPHWIEHAFARRPFTGVQMIGYRTKGGTYVLASSPDMTDDGRPHDLVAILAAPVDGRQVIPIRFNVNPSIVAMLERELAAREEAPRG